MREKTDYRNNLERINNAFPNKEMLSVSDISSFTGICRAKIGLEWKNDFVVIGRSKCMSKATLARLISP